MCTACGWIAGSVPIPGEDGPRMAGRSRGQRRNDFLAAGNVAPHHAEFPPDGSGGNSATLPSLFDCGSLAGGTEVVAAVGGNGNAKAVRCVGSARSIVGHDGDNVTPVASPLEHTALGVRNRNKVGARNLPE